LVGTELFENPGKLSLYHYPAMTKTMTGAEVPGTPIQTFKLHVERGQFTDSEIVVMLGTCTATMVSSLLSVCIL
jgi:translation initiation factor RLI1